MADPRKILIIQLKRAGDVLLTTPIPLLLKRRWPNAEIHFLVDRAFAPLLEQHPAIDQIQLYDRKAVARTWRRLRRENYDQIFDFQSSPRSALAVWASGAAHSAGYRVHSGAGFTGQRFADRVRI